ncbi:MAG: pyridoxal-phosphate dependent enzyme [Nitrospirae bacterium]|nr:pyridoxal-phosphate dependent enzyme [Nitrospirota bacterium]
MSSSASEFLSAIDRRHSGEQSVVLRYRNCLRFEELPADDEEFKGLLDRTSIREGLRIFPLLTYRDVEILVLDETSLMHTHTLKSIDGAVTIARSLQRGYRRIAFESGGNTGTALSVYGRRVGLETFLVLPGENLSLLDSAVFEAPTSHLIAVRDRSRVKQVSSELRERDGLPKVPQPEWRLEASMFIGCYLLEAMLEGLQFDILAQTISAAFAPIGIYRVLRRQQPDLGRLPSFLGVQQAPNCPMYRALRGAETDAGEAGSTGRLLTRVMYDASPQSYGTVEGLRGVLDETAGDLTLVDSADFRHLLEDEFDGAGILSVLAGAGVNIFVRDREVVETTGLLALTGTLKEITAGRIAAGSRVLVCLTSGTGRPDGTVVPEAWAEEWEATG